MSHNSSHVHRGQNHASISKGIATPNAQASRHNCCQSVCRQALRSSFCTQPNIDALQIQKQQAITEKTHPFTAFTALPSTPFTSSVSDTMRPCGFAPHPLRCWRHIPLRSLYLLSCAVPCPPVPFSITPFCLPPALSHGLNLTGLSVPSFLSSN